MKATQGRIINIAAVTGIRGRKNAANFCCSKAGLLMLTKCAALELGPDILVNAIGLGFVRSESVKENFSDSQLAAIVDERRLEDLALDGIDHAVCYAVKANSNLAVLGVLARLGSWFDIVSAGELARVIAAGGSPDKVVFSGVGKTADEMRAEPAL